MCPCRETYRLDSAYDRTHFSSSWFHTVKVRTGEPSACSFPKGEGPFCDRWYCIYFNVWAKLGVARTERNRLKVIWAKLGVARTERNRIKVTLW